MKILIIVIGIIMLTNVMALYAGEQSEVITLPEEFEYYSIVGNESPIELEIMQQGLNVTITPSKYTKDESFTIIFFNKEKETIVQTIHTGGGGGSSSTKYVNKIIYEPKFYDRNITEEIEVEKIVEKEVEVIKETGYKLWHILVIVALTILALVIGWFIFEREQYEEEEPLNHNIYK